MPRYNKARNPTCRNDASGWYTFTGSTGTTATRVTNLSVEGRTTGIAVSVGTSSFAVGTSVGSAVASNGQTWSYVLWVRSTVARTIRHGLGKLNNNTFVSTFSTTDTSISANTWTRLRGVAAIPTGGTWNSLIVHLDLPTAASSSTLNVAAVRLEQISDSALNFADGDTGGQWSWDGTVGSSTSTMSDGTAPTVDAGADGAVNQFETFTRTGTVVSNGNSAITSQSWQVISGPSNNSWPQTVSSSATVSYRPETPGSYTLRYTATNAIGSASDDLVLTVDNVGHIRVSSIRLLGTAVGSANKAAIAPSNPLRLKGTRVGAKQAIRLRTALIKLAATRDGKRINARTANIRLKGILSAYGRPGASSAIATIKLKSNRTGSSSRVGGSRIARIRAFGAVTGIKVVTGTRTANVKLTAYREDFIKDVPASRTIVIKLKGNRSGGIHRTSVNRTATIKPKANAINRSRVTPNVPHTMYLILIGTPNATSTRVPSFVSANISLGGVGFGNRIITEALTNAVQSRADNTTKYELVCVARVPQTMGPPVLIEVDPIDWTGLTITEELSAPGKLSASVKVNSLTETVLQRLRKPSELATELWLYRDGKQVFAGPLLGINASSRDSVSLEAGDLMTYLSMMGIAEDLAFPPETDQFTIVKKLIDTWQNYEYGNFGIDTSSINPSGVQRGLTYLFKELTKVDKAIDDLRKMEQGFDIDIDPTNRMLRLYNPYKGVDRSDGPDAIVFDASNISSSNLTWSASPVDLSSDAFGTATGENDAILSSHQFNQELRTRYGRTVYFENYDKVQDQTTLDSYTLASMQARDDILLIPGPNARVTPDSDIASYGVGDTVSYTLHEKLTTAGGFRLRKRTINVSQTGQESVSPEFV